MVARLTVACPYQNAVKLVNTKHCTITQSFEKYCNAKQYELLRVGVPPDRVNAHFIFPIKYHLPFFPCISRLTNTENVPRQQITNLCIWHARTSYVACIVCVNTCINAQLQTLKVGIEQHKRVQPVGKNVLMRHNNATDSHYSCEQIAHTSTARNNTNINSMYIYLSLVYTNVHHKVLTYPAYLIKDTRAS